jgi:hypothetical protein
VKKYSKQMRNVLSFLCRRIHPARLFFTRNNLMVVALLFFSFSCIAQKNYRRMKVTVAFDVYSGRVNPAWDLSAEECKELLKRLNALPVADKAINDGGLGYSGFSLTITADTLQKSSRNLRVFKKIISKDKGNSKNYRDIHGLEDWLFLQASGRGYTDIVDGIKSM